jgi:hypothetical protein
VTYLLKSEQFPVLGINSTIYAIATIILIVTFLSIYNKKQIKYNTTVFNEAVTACTKNIFGGSMRRQVLVPLIMCFGMISANIYL